MVRFPVVVVFLSTPESAFKTEFQESEGISTLILPFLESNSIYV